MPSEPDANAARHPLSPPSACNLAAFRLSAGQQGRLPALAQALLLKCSPLSGRRGPGRSADSCQSDSDSRTRALPALRNRVRLLRVFLTSRNCRAGPLAYHMASSTCCRLVSISPAGPTWPPLRTSPSCPSASSPAVSRRLQTLARPSSRRLTSLFLLRSQCPGSGLHFPAGVAACGQ